MLKSFYNIKVDEKSLYYKDFDEILNENLENKELIEQNFELLKKEFLCEEKCNGNELEDFVLGTRVFIVNELIRSIEEDDLNDLRFLELKNNFENDSSLKFLSVNSNGSITLLNKDNTELRTESYNNQEILIALLIHFKPNMIYVYDKYKLLKPELAFTLKRNFQNGVEFINEEYPLHYN